MTIEEYFGDWMKVLDKTEAMKIMGWLRTVNPNTLCPTLPNVFRAFKLCSYNKLRCVMLFQDPYPQQINGIPVATGIAIGNSKDTPEDKLSPSLQVVKESAINYEIPHNPLVFDNTLESWAKQGILMINSALTCEVNRVGSHVNEWRPFVSKLLKNLSTRETGIIYVLFGRQAQTLKPYIDERYNDIIEIEHPAFFARTNQIMPYSVFEKINNLLYFKYREKIEWYKEEYYENESN